MMAWPQRLHRLPSEVFAALLLAVTALSTACSAKAQEAAPVASDIDIDTYKLMLSGTGPDDAVLWDFTIDGGMRAGEEAKIAVPSNWQQQGFGHYRYGVDNRPVHSDRGIYRRSFTIPADWKGKRLRLVFDGVATDTDVKLNGTALQPVHQGGFYRFSYEIGDLVKPGEANQIEVAVSETSAAVDTDRAERRGDYWALSGIFRPVWIEAMPREAIDHVAIDAKANGDITADIALVNAATVTRAVGQVRMRDGRGVGAPFVVSIPAGGVGTVRLSGHLADPALWSAETPNLYDLDVTLYRGEVAVHHVRSRFGFRTFELVEGRGLYLNGQHIVLKGTNRHSFRPDTGRSLTREQSYDDVRTMRAMNMNAARSSHYPPEESFLEAADELGLYVLDELSGWQHAHDTTVGRRIVREMVERDVNHPSILFWDNGNEGGFNLELDRDYGLYDPQKRPVIHPWSLFNGINTKHYPTYAQLKTLMGGHDLVMPTEFLHGLFDGGQGAGLDDYWTAITSSPLGSGGFLWSFADEGIARTDENGRIDVRGTLAPDGIVGPWHEPEASVATVKDLWSPVQITPPRLDAAFDGRLAIANSYDFLNLSAISFEWQWLRFAQPDARGIAPRILRSGFLQNVALAPHSEGWLSLPAVDAANVDAVRLIAQRDGEMVNSWIWPVAGLQTLPNVSKAGIVTPSVAREGHTILLRAGKTVARFNAVTGLLSGFGTRALEGPRLIVDRPPVAAAEWTNVVGEAGLYRSENPGMANLLEIETGIPDPRDFYTIEVEISPDGTTWHRVFSGGRMVRDGKRFVFPPQIVQAIRIRGLSAVKSMQLGFQPDRFAAPQPLTTVTSGMDRDPATHRPTAWLDAPGAGGLARARWTMRDDGSLTLDYGYHLSGPVLYHGIGFDGALTDVSDVRGLLKGPSPVWKNRTRGPLLGVYDVASIQNKLLPKPAEAGYFADPRWVRLSGSESVLLIRAESPIPFVQLGSPIPTLPNTTADFPTSDLGFLNAIPAIGNKFQAAIDTGPAGGPSQASGDYAGTLTFKLLH
jgi:hypothetical protein